MSSMFFEAERALKKGYLAWFRGELDVAVSCLERARTSRPSSPDVLYPLARALSEKNELSRALALLDEAAAIDPRGGSRVFRALILYDHGALLEARGEASRIHPRNILARTLNALLEFRRLDSKENDKSESGTIAVPAAAPWIPDASGRLLAVLEERLHSAGAEGALQFHHLLLAPETPSHSKPTSPATRAGWESLLEAAFAERRYRDVESLFTREDLPRDWISLPANVYRAFSLLAAGNEARTASFLSQMLKAHPGSADLHFLEGLRHAWSGRRGEAGWSFARAARLSDTRRDFATEFFLVHLMGGISRNLGIELRLEH